MRYLLLAILFASTLALASCNTAGGTNPYLVGTWFWNDDSRFEYTFNEDGTGIRGWFGDEHPFTWSTNGATLRIRCQASRPMFNLRNERWGFYFEGNTVTLSSIQAIGVIYSYVRDGVVGDVYPLLVGTWAWDDNSFWAYVLNEDGTGYMGWPGEAIDLTWGVTDGVLRIRHEEEAHEYIPRNATWLFAIANGVLSLESPSNEMYTYTKEERYWEVNPILLGTWFWDEDSRFEHTFAEDGTGIRGWPGELAPFIWSTSGYMLVIHCLAPVHFFGVSIELWNFILGEDTIRLACDQAYVIYYHIRDGVVGDAYPALVGAWAWDYNVLWSYILYADGTGYMGWLGDEICLIWGVSDGILRIRHNGYVNEYISRNATWAFFIDNETLLLEAPCGDTHTYTKKDHVWGVNHILIDTWVWYNDHSWVYILNEDGTGFMGFDYDKIEITWDTSGDNLRFFYYYYLLGVWNFNITDNYLTLECPFTHGIRYLYIRESAVPDAYCLSL